MLTRQSQEPDVDGLHVISVLRPQIFSQAISNCNLLERRLSRMASVVSVQLSSVCSAYSARP